MDDCIRPRMAPKTQSSETDIDDVRSNSTGEKISNHEKCSLSSDGTRVHDSQHRGVTEFHPSESKCPIGEAKSTQLLTDGRGRRGRSQNGRIGSEMRIHSYLDDIEQRAPRKSRKISTPPHEAECDGSSSTDKRETYEVTPTPSVLLSPNSNLTSFGNSVLSPSIERSSIMNGQRVPSPGMASHNSDTGHQSSPSRIPSDIAPTCIADDTGRNPRTIDPSVNLSGPPPPVPRRPHEITHLRHADTDTESLSDSETEVDEMELAPPAYVV